MTVILTVHLDCGHDLTYQDSIEEKYPFYCETCDDTPTGKYPWSIETRVEDADEQVCNCPCSNCSGCLETQQ